MRPEIVGLGYNVTTKPEGRGIGLSFSRRLMRMHGGTLRVHSRPGKRTTFTLRF